MDTPRGWEILHSSLFPVYPLDPEHEHSQELTILVESPRGSFESKRVSVSNHSSPTHASSRDSSVSPRPQSMLSRSSSSATTTTSRNSTLLSNARKRQSMVNGSSPPNARLSKLIGDLFLLAGRLIDASTWYAKSVSHQIKN